MADFRLFLLLILWTVDSADVKVKNYETATIEECVPGKYFWRETEPQEFYACLTKSKKAIKMKCLDGKNMCNTGPKRFQPCMCADAPTPRGDGDRPKLQERESKADFRDLKNGVFSQFAKMGSDAEDPDLTRMRDEVNAALMSTTPALDALNDPRPANMLSLPSTGCPAAYQKSENTHMLGGELKAEYTTLVTCQQACLRSAYCIGVDWNKETNGGDNERCYFISPEKAAGFRSRMSSTCCDHYRRTLCTGTGDQRSDENNVHVRVGTGGSPGEMEATAPTSPRHVITTTTTAAPLAQTTTTIPDSGCPYTFEEFSGASHPFGQNVTRDGMNADPESCKYWCLKRSDCHAVDFDVNTNTCYYLAQVVASLVTTMVSGVTHYRKVDCTRPLRCFTSSMEVTSPEDLSVTDPQTPQTPCRGVCYTRETIGVSNTVDRGCMASSVPVALGCQLSDNLMTVTCFCDTMRCNAISVVAMATQLLHLPLDGDADDHSGTGNPTTSPENYAPPEYQCLDKAINCSALFTGNQCIKVTSLANTDFGVVDAGQNFEFSPEATFSVYFKRITTTDSPGHIPAAGIFGNSDDPNVQPTWRIGAMAYNNYTTAGLTSEDTLLSSLNDYNFVKANNDEWHLMVMTYEGLFDYDRKIFPKLSIYLDGKAVDGNSMLEEGKIGISSLPVTVGCVGGNNFFGYVDEARIFVKSLPKHDIKALHVMRDENFWY